MIAPYCRSTNLFSQEMVESLKFDTKEITENLMIIDGLENSDLDKDFQSVSIERKEASDYLDFIKNRVVKGLVNVNSPKFIGHMTGPVPPVFIELNNLMVTLNQNLVKLETSGIGTLIERQCIGMLHALAYKKEDNFYQQRVQSPIASLGVVTGGGTLSNLTALNYALSHKLQKRNEFKGLNREGLTKALLEYGYKGVKVIGSRRCHYSIGKAMKMLGIGQDSFIAFDYFNDVDGPTDIRLQNLIDSEVERGYLILALIGVAGSTETGSVDPLTMIGEIAHRNNIHFHVDAAFGGGYLFSNTLSCKIKGVELSDSLTICGHKQLYLPMGLSVCLFKDENLAKYSENNTKYQAREDSLDLGRYTIEGSRPFLSLVLHGALNLMGIEGYAEIIESNYSRAQLFKQLIHENGSFQLLEESDLNIVNYRFIPDSLRNNRFEFSAQENKYINSLNKAIQEMQFKRGKSFVSYTELDSNLLWFRSVLMNPETTKTHLLEILAEQEELASYAEMTIDTIIHK